MSVVHRILMSLTLLINAVHDGMQEICTSYEFEGETPEETLALHKELEKTLLKYLKPVFAAKNEEVSTKTIETKTGKPKKSHTANYYATFHSLCSKNGKHKIEEESPEITYSFQENPVKLNEKQQALHQQIIEDPELCEKFAGYESTVLHDVVEFVEKELKIDQMTRTSMIWFQFMNEEAQNTFKSWHKALRDGTLYEKPVRKPTSSPKAKVTSIKTGSPKKETVKPKAVVKTKAVVKPKASTKVVIKKQEQEQEQVADEEQEQVADEELEQEQVVEQELEQEGDSVTEEHDDEDTEE